jgi:hypothetical protein
MATPCAPEGRARAIMVRSNMDGAQCLLGDSGAIHRVTVSTSYTFPVRVFLHWQCSSGLVEKVSAHPDPVQLDLLGSTAQRQAVHEWMIRKSSGAPTGPVQVTVRIGWCKLLTDRHVGKEAQLSSPLIYNLRIQ